MRISRFITNSQTINLYNRVVFPSTRFPFHRAHPTNNTLDVNVSQFQQQVVNPSVKKRVGRLIGKAD